jgi:subtilisin-like proprotein convertase family protein
VRDPVDSLGIRLGRVVADAERDVAQLSAATNDLHLEHHPKAARGRWQIDLEAVGQLGAFRSFGFA